MVELGSNSKICHSIHTVSSPSGGQMVTLWVSSGPYPAKSPPESATTPSQPNQLDVSDADLGLNTTAKDIAQRDQAARKNASS